MGRASQERITALALPDHRERLLVLASLILAGLYLGLPGRAVALPTSAYTTVVPSAETEIHAGSHKACRDACIFCLPSPAQIPPGAETAPIDPVFMSRTASDRQLAHSEKTWDPRVATPFGRLPDPVTLFDLIRW